MSQIHIPATVTEIGDYAITGKPVIFGKVGGAAEQHARKAQMKFEEE